MVAFLVVGSMNFDVICQADRLPREHEKVRANAIRLCPGGAASNTAYWLGRSGERVEMVGAVGADHFGERSLESLRSAGVDVGQVHVESGRETRVVSVWSTPDDKRMLTSPGPTLDPFLDGIRVDHVGPDHTVHVATRPGPELADFCRRVTELGARLSVEFNGRPMDEIREWVDIGFMNGDELERLTGTTWQELTPSFLDRFLPHPESRLVVTLGREGAVAVDRSGVVKAETTAITPVDRTGAGDAFDAACLRELAHGAPVEDALKSGLELATTVLQMVGSRP